MVYDPLVYCCPSPRHTDTLNGTAAVAPNFLQSQPSAPLTAGEGNPTTPMPTTLEQPATIAGNVLVKTPDTSKNKEDLTLPISGLPPYQHTWWRPSKLNVSCHLETCSWRPCKMQLLITTVRTSKRRNGNRPLPCPIQPTECAHTPHSLLFLCTFNQNMPLRWLHMAIPLARDVGGLAWSRYDRTFRQAATVNHQLTWCKCEQDIWLQAACEPPYGAPLTTVTRSPSAQTTTLPSSRPLVQADVPQPRRLPSPEPCHLWNNGHCSYIACRYWHVCWHCLAPMHVGTQYPFQ